MTKTLSADWLDFNRPDPSGPDPTRGVLMAYVLYRDHTIVPSAVMMIQAENRNLNACVSWQVTGAESSSSNPLKTFACVEDAETAGIEYSKIRVGNKLS